MLFYRISYPYQTLQSGEGGKQKAKINLLNFPFFFLCLYIVKFLLHFTKYV